MNTLEQWLSAYAESHQDPTNKKIHNICVPVIFFVLVALLWEISFLLMLLVGIGAAWFYYNLSPQLGLAGGAAILICALIQAVFGFSVYFLILLFVLAWAGQFYGHKIEGKQPSFMEDLKFLLIGPVWVAEPLLRSKGIISGD